MEQTEKTWFTLVVIGFIEVLVFVAYQVYFSLSGQSVILVKKVSDVEVPDNIGTEELKILDKLEKNILVKNSELN